MVDGTVLKTASAKLYSVSSCVAGTMMVLFVMNPVSRSSHRDKNRVVGVKAAHVGKGLVLL